MRIFLGWPKAQVIIRPGLGLLVSLLRRKEAPQRTTLVVLSLSPSSSVRTIWKEELNECLETLPGSSVPPLAKHPNTIYIWWLPLVLTDACSDAAAPAIEGNSKVFGPSPSRWMVVVVLHAKQILAKGNKKVWKCVPKTQSTTIWAR